jgi:hypothetical protein
MDAVGVEVANVKGAVDERVARDVEREGAVLVVVSVGVGAVGVGGAGVLPLNSIAVVCAT